MSNEEKKMKKMNVILETSAPPAYINGKYYNLNNGDELMEWMNEQLKMRGIRPDKVDKE